MPRIMYLHCEMWCHKKDILFWGEGTNTYALFNNNICQLECVFYQGLMMHHSILIEATDKVLKSYRPPVECLCGRNDKLFQPVFIHRDFLCPLYR